MAVGARTGLDQPGWPPPRGPRDPETGRFLWPLHGRPAASFRHDWEAETVAFYTDLVGQLVEERLARGLSVRAFGAVTGISIATVTGIENGSWWPRWGTLTELFGALDRRLAVRPAGDVTAAWDADVPVAVHHHIGRQRGLSFTSVAADLELQPKTVSDLARTASPSAATVLALCVRLGLHVRPRRGAEGSPGTTQNSG